MELLVDIFERAVEAGEGLLEGPGAVAAQREIAVTELIAYGDDGGAHGAVFVGPLSPGDSAGAVDPKRKSHPPQVNHSGFRVKIGQMPSEKELLERIRQLEEMNSALQDKLDMIYAIVVPDFDEEPAPDGDDDEGLVQIDGIQPPKKTN